MSASLTNPTCSSACTVPYPVAVDAGANAAYRANSFPDYYLIDRSGVLRWADIANADVEKAIGILLKEKKKKKK